MDRLPWIRLGLTAALGVLASCDESGDHDDSVCFPLPGGDVARLARAGEKDQGRSLQGGELPGEREQGRSLQGGELPGEKDQGRALQGGPAPIADRENNGAFLGIADLNGAVLELPDTHVVSTVRDGALVTGGLARVREIVDEELVVRVDDGREFRARVTKLEATGSGERFAVIVEGTSVCAPGDEGMFVAGHWDDDGAHAIDGDELTYACMDGVIAKCVDWGYAPWALGADVHQSCTRLARADYCGDGRPWTLDGTTIDAYDVLGVQARLGDPSFGFEAAWGEHGAICVNETRYVVQDQSGDVIRPDCFAELPTCESLEAATALGAVLANDSAHISIAACE